MTEKESFFSRIKPQEPPEEEAPGAAPLPPPEPQPRPEQHEELCAKVAALEARIMELEGRGSAADQGLKAEVQAVERRVTGLERDTVDYKKVSVALPLALEQFKVEVTALRARAAAMEDAVRSLAPSGSDSVNIATGILEGRLKSLEAGLAIEISERFSSLDAAFGETARKAGLSQEIAERSARHVKELEGQVARLPYIENQLSSNELKLAKVCDLDALSYSLKAGMEEMEKDLSAAIREFSLISDDHKDIRSGFESVSRQVWQLTALFNQFRTELAVSIRKKQETAGR